MVEDTMIPIPLTMNGPHLRRFCDIYILQQSLFRRHHCILKKGNESIYWKSKSYDENQGWIEDSDIVEPRWSSAPIWLTSLIDLIENADDALEEQDYEEIFDD